MSTSHRYMSLSSMRPAENPSTGFLFNSERKREINIIYNVWFTDFVMLQYANLSKIKFGENIDVKYMIERYYMHIRNELTEYIIQQKS